MEKDDAQLIHKILSGDDTAFSTLVQKYQKTVHTLVWQKIGDFHHAEEITQDTFLQAYQKLATLRDPNRFARWLYVIADRLCVDWVRKQKPTMQSLDDTRMDIVEQISYTRYISEQHETKSIEDYCEIVDNLLQKLPERERTVVTLYYLDEMTTREIGRFLGVSVNTIQSWLYRARKRLQGGAFIGTQETGEELEQTDVELILKKIVPKMLSTIEKKIYAGFQAQLGKSIHETEMSEDMIKQMSEKMASDIGEKIRTELQKKFKKEFPKT
ncbi:MAG: RNA polymerase sigma factor [Candidatus Poribacteria bacterium]|nr:RNA polymerase sigma factor [Candidatus Poribacteria bacterium]